MLTQKEIQKILPHRYPFLLIDRVEEIEPGKRILAIKNVSINEPFFQGHFPGNPVMPGVLIVEALAQAAGIMAAYQQEKYAGKLGLFAGIESMKFRRPVVPGDVLKLEAELETEKRNIIKAKVRATVVGSTAAEGVISFAMVDAGE